MRVCIVKTSALGDIVQTFPVLAYLTQRHPAIQIDWVVERPFMDLLTAHPAVQRAIPVNTKSWREQLFSAQCRQELRAFRQAVAENPYDIVFDLQSNLKSGLVTWQIPAVHKVGFCGRTAREWPNILFTNQRFTPLAGVNARLEYLQIVQSYFKDNEPFEDPGIALRISTQQQAHIRTLLQTPGLQQGRKILVSGGSAWRNKQLPTQTLREFLRLIAHDMSCSFLFSWGSNEERNQAAELHHAFPENSVLLERLPLPVLQNLMGHMNLVIAMDSLPLHLAATSATPTFGLFGPSSASKFNPSGPHHHAFQGSCPYGRTFPRRCPILRTCPTGACLREQSANKLLESFREWFKTLN